jgi:L-ascorbate metabolism protein UlaG (beta-lactamase superfamily)
LLAPRRRLLAAPTVVARLTFFGQSCFLLESAAGTRVLMDPVAAGIGYAAPVDLRVDAVTISHEHGDHNNVALVAGKARVFRGLTADRKGWMRIDERVKDVAVRSVGVYHDADKGAKRGLNTVFVFEIGGVRIAHLGDLGHQLTDQQLSAIGSVDVVLVPVGGGGTVDAREATRVVDQIRPRLIVIPMHYRTDVSGGEELARVDEFLDGKQHFRREKRNVFEVTAVKRRPSAEIVVLDYK